ncbi:hypothetical protein M3Y97_00750000 [Aphelenchoides bicaudatus]|nr:hypothetical protein M3Y97_00750000 [Aphelenchoides bicaudatus]
MDERKKFNPILLTLFTISLIIAFLAFFANFTSTFGQDRPEDPNFVLLFLQVTTTVITFCFLFFFAYQCFFKGFPSKQGPSLKRIAIHAACCLMLFTFIVLELGSPMFAKVAFWLGTSLTLDLMHLIYHLICRRRTKHEVCHSNEQCIEMED